MAGQRFWNRLLGRRYAPSQQSKPLFMERRLDNLFGGDKGGKFGILDPLVRTIEVSPQTGRPLHVDNEWIIANAQAVVALGGFNIPIQPAGQRINEIWEVMRITAFHNSAGDEEMAIQLFDNTGLWAPAVGQIMFVTDEPGHTVPNNAEWPIYPMWHDALGANDHDHIIGYDPIRVTNDRYLNIVNASAFANGVIVTIQWMMKVLSR